MIGITTSPRYVVESRINSCIKTEFAGILFRSVLRAAVALFGTYQHYVCLCEYYVCTIRQSLID